MCLRSAGHPSPSHPSWSQLSRGSSPPGADRHPKWQMEFDQAHQDISNRFLWNHWIPRRRIHEQGHGESDPPRFMPLQSLGPSQWTFFPLCSTFGSHTTPSPTTFCIWWWRTGSWSSPRCSSLCMEVYRTLTSSQNSSKCLAKAWSKRRSPQEPGSSQAESTRVGQIRIKLLTITEMTVRDIRKLLLCSISITWIYFVISRRKLDKAIVTGLGSINRDFAGKISTNGSLCGFACICHNMVCMVAPFIQSHVTETASLFDPE